MFKKIPIFGFLALQLCSIQLAQAAFILSDGDELAPLSQKSMSIVRGEMNGYQVYKKFQTLHELTKADQKEFFEEFKGKNRRQYDSYSANLLGLVRSS